MPRAAYVSLMRCLQKSEVVASCLIVVVAADSQLDTWPSMPSLNPEGVIRGRMQRNYLVKKITEMIQLGVMMPNEGEGHDTHIGEYATSASSSESEAEERRDSAGVNILPPSAPDGYRMLQHRRTKTIHYILAGSARVMACGSMVAEAHREPDVAGLRPDAAVCRCCKNAVV